MVMVDKLQAFFVERTCVALVLQFDARSSVVGGWVGGEADAARRVTRGYRVKRRSYFHELWWREYALFDHLLRLLPIATKTMPHTPIAIM
jgi:hypothetical protein